jgi:archaellum biogenesis ATPase FlaH
MVEHDAGEAPPVGEAPWLPYSEIEQQEIEWVVPGLVPRGMLTLLAGDPGIGKSLLSVHWASELSRVDRRTVLASAEDSPSHVTIKRLRALEAKLEHVIHAAALPILPGAGAGGRNDWLADQAERCRADLLVFDPFTAMLAETHSSWSDQHVRRALGPLSEIAMTLNVGIVYVLHLNKSAGTNALQRIGGSIGFSAAARSVVLMAVDPTDERGTRRFVAHAKSNVSELAPTQTYEVEPIELPRLNGYASASTARLKYIGLSELGPAELLGPRPSAEEKSELEEATAFLIGELAGGPAKVRELENAARAAGIAQRTLERARRELGCRAVRVMDHWEVKLPDELTAAARVDAGWAPGLQPELGDDDEPF